MPVILHQKNKSDDIILWKINPGEFPEINSEQYNVLKNLQLLRKKQKLACLQMLSDFDGKAMHVVYDEFGKPHLKDDSRKISFSHSGEYAAVMISDKEAGIDFEQIRPKVLNIIHKFLNDSELESLDSQNTILHAHVYWGAKESLYKVYGRQQLLFKSNILVSPFKYTHGNGQISAKIFTSDYEKSFTLKYKEMWGNMLVHIDNEN